jgi:hypothetical protein
MPKATRQSEATNPRQENSAIVVNEASACVLETERIDTIGMVVITTSKMPALKYTGLEDVVRWKCLWAIAEHR